MKATVRYFILCYLLVTCNVLSAQSSFYKKEMNVPTELGLNCKHISTFDSGMIVLVQYYDTSFVTFKNTVIKTDSDGNIQWTKRFLGTQSNEGFIAQCYDSGYVITWSEFSSGVNNIIVRLDMNGNVIYTKQISAVYPYSFLSESFLIPRRNGNLIVAGTVFDNSNSTYVWNVYELDTVGHILWSKGYNTNPAKNFLMDVDTLPSGDVMLFGTTYGMSPNQYNLVLTRITTSGNVIWSNEYATQGYDMKARSLVCLTDDHIYAAGAAFAMNSWISEVGLMRIDNTGNQEWTFKFNEGFGSLEPLLIASGSANSTVVCGMMVNGTFLLRSDTTGIIMSARSFPASHVKSMDTLSNGKYCFAGFDSTFGTPILFTTDQMGAGCYDTTVTVTKTPLTTVFTPFGNDTQVPMLDSDITVFPSTVLIQVIEGCIFEAIEETEEMRFQIYPIPCSNMITIESNTAPDAIEIFDVTGNQVYSNNQCGRRTVIEVALWSPGIYFVRLFDGQTIATGKIIVE